jgi:endo-1,4-beta-D-glucanase Y
MRLPAMANFMLMGCTVLMFAPQAVFASSDCIGWPAWKSFRNNFIMDDGRVIDRSSPRQITTSEGQAYALFFALVAGDRPAFDNILQWTKNNLAGGDLTARLPAWAWGKRDDGSWGVLDSVAASDADLWLAYTLSEAGRLWHVSKFSVLSELIADRILREETDELPGLGRTMLPGNIGFHPAADTWRLNPSYVPLQLIGKFAKLYPDSLWPKLLQSSLQLIIRSAPTGFSPDWVVYKAGENFEPDPSSNSLGGYDAIRVYLWAGMLPEQNSAKKEIMDRLTPMADYVANELAPPEKIDIRNGIATGVGPVGFSAALLPFLASLKDSAAFERQRLRVQALSPFERKDNYYDQVLSLFGVGRIEERYRFTGDGQILPNWNCKKVKQSDAQKIKVKAQGQQ